MIAESKKANLETQITTVHEPLNGESDAEISSESYAKDHNYDTIGNEVINGGIPLECAVTADVNSEVATSRNLAIESGQGARESNPKSENTTLPSCKQNPAYAVLETQKDKTEYQNVVTPWSYYVSSEVDTSQNMAYGAFDDGQRVTEGCPSGDIHFVQTRNPAYGAVMEKKM